jgi:hypothetical protein
MNPRIAGRPGAVMADAAEQMGSVAEMGFHVAEKIKKAQDEGILLGAENQIGADIEKAQSGLANWTDYTHADQLKQDTATALQEKYSEQYGNRPDLWRHIEPYLVRQTNEFDGLVDRKSAQLTADYNKAQLFDSQLHTENEAATEPTIDGKERIWAIQDAKTDLMVKNGSIRAEEGEAAKKLLRSRTIAAEVDHAANPMNAPEIMEAEMARLKDYEGKNWVPAEKLAEYQKTLGEAYKVASRLHDEKAIAKDGNAILAGISKDPTVKDPATGEIDYLKAAKQVDENPDIPTDRKKYVREELEQRDAVQKRITNESNQKILDKESPRLYDTKNPLTSAEVKQRALLSPLDPKYIPREVESHLLTALGQLSRENRAINTQARMEMRQESAYDSAEVLREAENTPGYFEHESELYQGDYSKLNNADRKTLWAAKRMDGSKELQDAYKMMNAATSVYPATDEGNAKLATDKEALRQAVDAKKLTGKQVIDEAEGILKPKQEEQKKSWVKSALDNMWNFGERVDLGEANLVRRVVGKPPVQPKNETEQAIQQREAQDRESPPGPKVGDVVRGYKFLGGYPADPHNWEKQ